MRRPYARQDCAGLVGGIVDCMQDRSKEVRAAAERMVQIVIPMVGQQPFMEAIKDLKPTVKVGISEVLKKYEGLCRPSAVAQMQVPGPEPSNNGEPMEIDFFQVLAQAPPATVVINLPPRKQSADVVKANNASLPLEQSSGMSEKMERVEMDKRVKWGRGGTAQNIHGKT